LLCITIAVVWSAIAPRDAPGYLELGDVRFGTSTAFNTSAAAVAVILVALYTTWW